MGEQWQTLYEAIGGEEKVAKLVEAFYRRVAAHPDLRPIFPDDLTETARKQKQFLTPRVLIIQNYTYAFHKFGHTQTKQRPSRISNREEAAQRKNGERTK